MGNSKVISNIGYSSRSSRERRTSKGTGPLGRLAEQLVVGASWLVASSKGLVTSI